MNQPEKKLIKAPNRKPNMQKLTRTLLKTLKVKKGTEDRKVRSKENKIT